MPLEQQVTSLELSKRLKELGVKQESYFSWVLIETKAYDNVGVHSTEWIKEKELEKYITASAFTVAELGEMLPWRSKRMGTVNNAELMCTKLVNTATSKRLWCVAYWDEDKPPYIGFVVDFKNETEAEARGLMLCYLLENKSITV